MGLEKEKKMSIILQIITDISYLGIYTGTISEKSASQRIHPTKCEQNSWKIRKSTAFTSRIPIKLYVEDGECYQKKVDDPRKLMMK